MMIEKLEPSGRKAGRWLVWFEDGSLVRVGEGDVVSLSLYAGKELTEEEAAVLTEAAEHSKLSERAVNLLSARPMSRKELEDRLSAPIRRRPKPGQELPPPDPALLEGQRERLCSAARRVADRMEELGLLDDGEYARTVARHYGARGYGPRKIRDELYRRGVPRQYWEEALAQLPGEDGGDSRLDELVRRRLRGEEPTRENLKRTSDWLARRGFGWEEISAALERYRAAGIEDE